MGLAGGSGSHTIVPTRIDMGDVMNEAFRIFKSEMGLLVGVNLFVIVISAVLGQVVKNMNPPLVQNFEVLGIVAGVVLQLSVNVVDMFLGIGQTILVLNVVIGRKASFSDVFSGGPYFWRILGGSIIFGLMVGIGMVFLIVPGIILALMFGQFYNLIVDRDMGLMQSLEVTRQLTAGNKGTLLVLALVSIGIGILGVFACVIGVLFAIPYIQVMGIVAYRRMAGLPIMQEGALQGPVA